MPSRSQVRALEDRARQALITLEHLLAPSEIKGRGTCLADLLYRSELSAVADGLAARQLDVFTTSGHMSDPTPGVAFARMNDVCPKCDGGKRSKNCKACGNTGRRFSDPVGEATADLLANLRTLCNAADVVARRQDLIFATARVRVGRESSLQGVCCVPACARVVSGSPSDRLKRGYCPRCYLRFCSWRLSHRTDDDRGAFAAFMAQKLSEQAKKEGAQSW